jgi:hypothetical protein
MDEASGYLERHAIFEAGPWELLADDNNEKIVIARETGSGEAYGYGGLTPELFTIENSLAIDSINNLLSINSNGDSLLISA